MPAYRFAVIVSSKALSHEAILDVTDKLGDAGCTDASIRGHELLFARMARSLQAAITSAIADIEGAGFRVLRVEMEREAIPGRGFFAGGAISLKPARVS